MDEPILQREFCFAVVKESQTFETHCIYRVLDKLIYATIEFSL